MATHAAGVSTRPRRRKDTSLLSVERLTTFADLERLREPWARLYERSGSRNPYVSPHWAGTWARHFTREEDLWFLAVRRCDELVGVAPCYLRRLPLGVRTLQLIGTGRHAALTEWPAVLTDPAESRSVLRAVVQHWCLGSREWDWCEMPLSHDQGWLEPEWLVGEVCGRGLVRHKGTRPSVVLPLPGRVAELRPLLKRNIRESARSAANRLRRTGLTWAVTAHTTREQVRRALPVLTELHSARAELDAHRRHPDVLAVPGRAAFVDEALPALADAGQAEILTLDVDGTPVAAQAVLRAPRASYLMLSGVDPRWWYASPVTLLHLRAAERAIGAGHHELNLSMGPDVAKLRWSEQVLQHPEFVICGPGRRSQAAYAAYALAAEVAGIRREAVRHRVAKGPRHLERLAAAGPARERTASEGTTAEGERNGDIPRG